MEDVMKDQANIDIRNLFRSFGGDSGSYQEIQQEHVEDKAQQNWPIIQAVEHARATAPKLKSRVENPRSVAPAAKMMPATKPAPVASRHSVVPSALNERVEPVPAPSIFSRVAASPVSKAATKVADVSVQSATPQASANSLRGALNAIARPESVKAREKVAPEPVGVCQSNSNDTLNAVFTRLSGKPEPVKTPATGLRSMLSFLRK